MSEEDAQAELARVIYILCKIRDIVSLPEPRFHEAQWYRSQVEHVRRYVNEAFCEEVKNE